MSLVLTTETVPTVDRLDYWRDIICAVYVELDAEATGGDTFAGSVSLTSWGDARISHVSSTAQLVKRRRGASETDCLVSLQLAGSGRVTQAGRTAELEPGDFALYDASKPYELAFDDTFEQLVLQVPREELIARNLHLESAVARACSGSQGVGAIAAALVRSLPSHESEIPDDQRHRLGQQAVDVTATALASVIGSTTSHGAVRTFNRQRVLDFVERNLHDPSLSVALVADSFGVSTRTIQKLFADDNVLLSARIREARVARARRALADPARAHMTIARIAYDNGFGSPAQFARVFRSASGCSPREFRRLMLGRPDG